MRRSKFVLSLLSVAPIAAFARFYKQLGREGKAFKVKAGEGRYYGHIQLKGVNANIIDVKISGRDTDGDLAILQPAGKLEAFFVAMAALTKEPTPKQLVQLFRDHEMEIVGPPLEV